MTVVEFITRKNKIIFDKLGVILVPEDQIIECEQIKLDICNASYACPYCHIYAFNFECRGCPMANAGNACSDSHSSWRAFYDKANKAKKITRIGHWYIEQPELVALYDQYNSELASI